MRLPAILIAGLALGGCTTAAPTGAVAVPQPIYSSVDIVQQPQSDNPCEEIEAPKPLTCEQ